MSLKGELTEISIGAIIQTLSLDHQRGTLKVEAEIGERFFTLGGQGEITLVIPGKQFRLGELLLHGGLIDREALNQGLRHAKTKHVRLGEALIDLNLVTFEQIEETLRRKFREEFFELCLAQEGTFEFLFNLGPEAFFGREDGYSQVSMSTSGLIMDAMRQIDEFEKMRKAIRSNGAIFIRQFNYREAIAKLDIPEEVKQGGDLIDGKRTVGEIAQLYQRSRFELYEMFSGLMGRDLIRSLEAPEAIEFALECELKEDWDLATKYYDWAIFLDPGNLKFRLRHYNLLKRAGRTSAVIEAAASIADLELEKSNLDEALKFYEEARAVDPDSLKTLAGLHKVYRRLATEREDPKVREKSHALGLALAREQKRSALFREALETLAPLIEESANDLEVNLLDAELHDALREREAAVRRYERVIRILENETPDLARRIDVYRRLLLLDPARDDIRAKLREAMTQGAARERLLGRFRVGFGVAAIFAIALLGWLTIYEVPAQGLFNSAAELEAAGTPSSMARARDLLKRVVEEYPWASSADEAQDHLATVEQALPRLGGGSPEEAPGEGRIAALEAEVEGLRSALARLMPGGAPLAPASDDHILADARRVEARALEGAGRYLDAGRILWDLHRAGETGIAIPVLVKTYPEGSTVEVNGEAAGVGPIVIHVEPGSISDLVVSTPGRVPRRLTIPGEPTPEVVVALDRARRYEVPLTGEAAWIAGSDQGAVVLRERRGYVGIRDGTVLWRRDLAPTLGPHGPATAGEADLYIATQDGRLVAVDLATGYPRWSADLHVGTRVAPTALRDEVLVVGADGIVYRHRAADGELVGSLPYRTSPDAPLVRRGSFVAGTGFILDANTGTAIPMAGAPSTPIPAALGPSRLIAVTPSGEARAFDLVSGQVVWTSDLRARPWMDPQGVGDLFVLGCEDGRARGYRNEDGSPVFTTGAGMSFVCGPTPLGGTVLFGTADGRLVDLDPATGRVLLAQSLGRITADPLVTSDTVILLLGNRLVGLYR